MRAHSGAVGVMQRVFDAFWIFCAHYGSYLLYPSITRGLAHADSMLRSDETSILSPRGPRSITAVMGCPSDASGAFKDS